eukprot:1533183-Rhodomonas_salina.1
MGEELLEVHVVHSIAVNRHQDVPHPHPLPRHRLPLPSVTHTHTPHTPHRQRDRQCLLLCQRGSVSVPPCVSVCLRRRSRDRRESARGRE